MRGKTAIRDSLSSAAAAAQLVLDFFSESCPQSGAMEPRCCASVEENRAWREREWVAQQANQARSKLLMVLLRRTRSIVSLVHAEDYLSGRKERRQLSLPLSALAPDVELARQSGVDPQELVRRTKWNDWPDWSLILDWIRKRGGEVIIPPSVRHWAAWRMPQMLEARLALESGLPDSSGSAFDQAYPGATFRCISSSDALPKVIVGKVYVVKDRKTRLDERGRMSVLVSLMQLDTDSWHLIEGRYFAVSDRDEEAFNRSMKPMFEPSSIYREENLLRSFRQQRYARIQQRLASMNLPLFDHVARDTAEAVLRDRVLFCNPPRMGKTSQMIAWSLLKGARKTLVVCVKNGRRVFLDEFRRMGIPDQDVVLADSLEDFRKPGRFYLVTYSWLRGVPLRVSKRNRSLVDHHGEDVFCSVSSLLHQAYLLRGWKVSGARSVSRHGGLVHWKDVQVERCCRGGEAGAAPETGMLLPAMKAGTAIEIRRPESNGAGLPATARMRWMYETAQALQTVRVIHPSMTGSMFGSGQHIGQAEWKSLQVRMIGAPRSVMRADIVRRRFRFDCILVDEIHHIRNGDTLQSQAVRRLRARWKAGASGTITVNSPVELFVPLCWLLDAPSEELPYLPKNSASASLFYETRRSFQDRYVSFVVRSTGQYRTLRDGSMKLVEKRIQTPFLLRPAEFWQKIRAPWMMRRNYDDPVVTASLARAGLSIPPMRFISEQIDPDLEQKKLMAQVLHEAGKEFQSLSEQITHAGSEELRSKVRSLLRERIFSYLQLMRLIASAPGVLARRGIPYHGPFAGGKQARIRALAEDWALQGRKFLVISDIAELRQWIGRLLEDLGVIVFDPSWDDSRRDEAFEEFNLDAGIAGMVCGPRSVSESVDLSAATRVITVDLMWSPAPMIQCWSRVRTPKPAAEQVDNHVLSTRHSIDAHIAEVFYSKVFSMEQILDHRVLSRNETVMDLHNFIQRVLEDRSLFEAWNVDSFEPDFERPVFASLSDIVLPEDGYEE